MKANKKHNLEFNSLEKKVLPTLTQKQREEYNSLTGKGHFLKYQYLISTLRFRKYS